MSDPAPATPKRPLWANLVIGVYGLLTTALLLGPPAVALSSGDGGSILATAGFAVVLFGCGASLFVIPVPKGNRERVVARRTIWLPIIVSSLLAALVCLGFTVALHEFLFGNRDGFIAGVNSGYLVIFAVLAVWVGWLTLFGGMALSRGPESIGDRLWQRCSSGARRSCSWPYRCTSSSATGVTAASG